MNMERWNQVLAESKNESFKGNYSMSYTNSDAYISDLKVTLDKYNKKYGVKLTISNDNEHVMLNGKKLHSFGKKRDAIWPTEKKIEAKLICAILKKKRYMWHELNFVVR